MNQSEPEYRLPLSEHIVIPSPFEYQPQNVTRLGDFVTEYIVPKKGGEGGNLVGQWQPLFSNSPPAELMPYLYTAFSTLRKRDYTGTPPVFIDCGAGYGEVGMAASLAGFTAYNIEAISTVSQNAAVVAELAADQQIISKESVVSVHGSYYLPEYFSLIMEQFKEEYQLNTDFPDRDAVFDALSVLGATVADLSDPTLDRLNRKIAQYEKLSQRFADLPINKTSLTQASVVFSYPSDIFFSYPNGFIQQWKDRLAPNSRLVLVENNLQVREALSENKLKNFRYEGDITWPGQPQLLVFQK